MKKNLLALVAVVAAITLSSFTTRDPEFYYLVYISGDQTLEDSYGTPLTVAPDHEEGTGSTPILNWIQVLDQDDSSTITDDEVEDAFDLYNTGANSTLNDEEDEPGELDIKFILP